MKVLHLNIHSLPDKIDSLVALLDKLNEAKCRIDLILLCETYISDHTNLQRCNINGYNLIEKHRTNTMGGGVCIFVNNAIHYTVREDLTIFEEKLFESVFIEVKLCLLYTSDAADD